jgi:Calcium binding
MAKIKDEEREHRIVYEVIVDAYDDYEQNMGWFYYFEEGLEFPINATIKLALRGGKSEEKKVKIVKVKPDNEDKPMQLGIVEGKSERVQYISPEAIIGVKTTDENLEILNDWLYWHDFKMLG